jgi:hypothetical protein
MIARRWSDVLAIGQKPPFLQAVRCANRRNEQYQRLYPCPFHNLAASSAPNVAPITVLMTGFDVSRHVPEAHFPK